MASEAQEKEQTDKIQKLTVDVALIKQDIKTLTTGQDKQDKKTDEILSEVRSLTFVKESDFDGYKKMQDKENDELLKRILVLEIAEQNTRPIVKFWNAVTGKLVGIFALVVVAILFGYIARQYIPLLGGLGQ